MQARSAMLGLAAATAFSSAAIAAPCVQTALTKYTAPGFSCSVRSETFSGFSYVADKAVATVTAAHVTVIPRDNSPTNPGLTFSAIWFIGAVSATGDFLLAFSVDATPAAISGASTLLPGHASSPGSAIDITTLTPGGSFPAAVPPLGNGFGSTSFAPFVGPIRVNEVVTLTGPETLSDVTNRFQDTPAIPEPGSVSAPSASLAGAGANPRRLLAALTPQKRGSARRCRNPLQAIPADPLSRLPRRHRRTARPILSKWLILQRNRIGFKTSVRFRRWRPRRDGRVARLYTFPPASR